MDPSASQLRLKHRDLVDRYVYVCNEALSKNKEKFPFKQIFYAVEQINKNHPIEVIITEPGYQEAYAFYFGVGGINFMPHADCSDCQCLRSWRTSSSYLHKIVDDADQYITNPARINWDWVYDV